MKLTLHRGAETIGGSCIEIEHEGHRIILDLGLPLMEPGGEEIEDVRLNSPTVENGILPDVSGLYEWDTPSVKAVFITHPHMDHYGLASYVHPDIPVYMSAGTKEVMEILDAFTPHKCEIKNHVIFKQWKDLEIGPYTVRPHLVDHSGFDASALYIKAGRKKVFYTGDFRAHGNKGTTFENLIKHPIRNLDCLIAEGTTLGGQHEGLGSEKEVRQEMAKHFSAQNDMILLFCAGTNIDRIVCAYNACRDAGKLFVVDLYTMYVLHRLKALGAKLPPFKGDHLRVYYKTSASKKLETIDRDLFYKFHHWQIKDDELQAERRNIVAKLPVYVMDRLLNTLDDTSKVSAVYSMWGGYLKPDSQIVELLEKHHIELAHLHTSGHIFLKDLKRLVHAWQPQKIVPIHTLSAHIFESHFCNVHRIHDGETLKI